MTDDHTINKISSFLYNEFSKRLVDLSIFQNEDGTYDFFDKYTISNNKDSVKVESRSGFVVKKFNTLRNAVTWCVYDHRNKFLKSKRIEELDQTLVGVDLNIKMQERLMHNSKNLEIASIHAAKLQEERYKKKRIIEELDQYIIEARAWQSKKFATKINTK